MIALSILACSSPPPVEVQARRVSTDELEITVRANEPVCLIDRTPVPDGEGGFRMTKFAHQVLEIDDCRIHIELGDAPVGIGSQVDSWMLERCLTTGETLDRRIKLTDPLMRWQVQDVFWPGMQRRFHFQPRPEVVVDVGYRLPSEHASVLTREVRLSTGERANLVVKLNKPSPKSHWARSEPIPVPDLPILARDEPCTIIPAWKLQQPPARDPRTPLKLEADPHRVPDP